MDLHVPEAPIRSIKDFLIHIGIVTIGIVIALGLEQLVESHHRAHRAAMAIDGFRRELTDNRQQLSEVLAAMPGLRAQIAAEIANLDSPNPRAIHYPGIQYNLISTASWETAVATQALGELPYESVHRYAGAYGTFRLFDEIERKGLGDWQEMRSFGEDPGKLTPDQRHSLVEKLRFYENVTYVIDMVGKGATTACDEALAKP